MCMFDVDYITIVVRSVFYDCSELRVTKLPNHDWVVQGVISDWVVQGVISDWVVHRVISDWVVQGVISSCSCCLLTRAMMGNSTSVR